MLFNPQDSTTIGLMSKLTKTEILLEMSGNKMK